MITLRDSIQLFHTFLCNSQNYHPKVLWMTRSHCCTERYEIVALLPNSELTKGNNKRDAAAPAYSFFTTEDHDGWAL